METKSQMMANTYDISTLGPRSLSMISLASSLTQSWPSCSLLRSMPTRPEIFSDLIEADVCIVGKDEGSLEIFELRDAARVSRSTFASLTYSSISS